MVAASGFVWFLFGGLLLGGVVARWKNKVECEMEGDVAGEEGGDIKNSQ